MKRSDRLTLALIVLMLAVLISIAVLQAQHKPDDNPQHLYSSYGGNHDGYLAWFELLEASGFDVEHYGHRLGELDEHYQTSIVAGDSLDVSGWIKPQTIDATHFHAWIEAGGTAISLSNSFSKTLPATARVQSLQAISTKKPLRYAIFAAGIPIGRGHIYLLSAPAVLTNAEIAADNHAELAIELVRGSRPGRIAFEESSHGYGAPDNLIALLPSSAIWGFGLALGALVLWFFGVSWRVGPLRTPQSATVPSSREFILALAGLIERGEAWPELIAHIQQTLRERKISYTSAKPTEQAMLQKLLTMKPSRSPKNFILAVKTLQYFQPYHNR